MHNVLILAAAAAPSTGLLGGFFVPAIIVAIVIAVAIVGFIAASRYKTVPPNGIGVFYGRKYKFTYTEGDQQKTGERGFKIITGGGKILMPIVERYDVMSTAAFQVDIKESQVPTAKNVPVNIMAVATCRISPSPDEQSNAVQAFLGKNQSEIATTIGEILRGHVRSIIAKLTVEQILRDRAEFNKQVLEESSDEFRRLGIQIITLVVQDVQDAEGYIKALGRKETAAIIRDAEIATAEAKKETQIKTSNAEREAAEVKAQNAAKVADAEKTRDIQIAEFKVQTETKKAEADLANAIAKTSQEQALRSRKRPVTLLLPKPASLFKKNRPRSTRRNTRPPSSPRQRRMRKRRSLPPRTNNRLLNAPPRSSRSKPRAKPTPWSRRAKVKPPRRAPLLSQPQTQLVCKRSPTLMVTKLLSLLRLKVTAPSWLLRPTVAEPDCWPTPKVLRNNCSLRRMANVPTSSPRQKALRNWPTLSSSSRNRVALS
jgi:regulator of protease activity HflC (stomatin/prohibitin superfamily)